jgi:hypothetical protein
MSGHGFHVHGPHDHELEHAREAAAAGHDAGHGAKDRFTSTVAVTTAILATVGALFAYMGGATQANAGLFKNNAAIKKTEASNQWNYYQAKSSKQNLYEALLPLQPPERRAQFEQEIARYKTEKAEIMAAARKLEDESTAWDKRSDDELHLHHRWAQATTALQVSIALAAVALLTRRKWLEWAMFIAAGGGLALGGMAALHV